MDVRTVPAHQDKEPLSDCLLQEARWLNNAEEEEEEALRSHERGYRLQKPAKHDLAESGEKQHVQMKKQIWKKIRMRNIERIRKRRPANTNNHLIQKMDGLEKKIEMLTAEIQALRKEFSHFGNNVTSVESDPSLPSTAQALTFAGHEQNFSSAELAPGVIIGVAELRNCRRSNYQRFTRDLMSVIFTEEDMAKCSVLGKRGVAGRGAAQRPPLPYDKVQAIIYHVQEQFFINPSLIRQAMASKLSDVRKSLQKRHSVT